MNTYLAVKHLHVACVVFSGVGFLLRGVLMLTDSPWLELRALKIVPHINDTLLLAAALTLAAMSGQYPFVEPWLTAKVFGLFAYIILGSLALKHARGKPARAVCGLLALLAFAYIVAVAITRNAYGLFALLQG